MTTHCSICRRRLRPKELPGGGLFRADTAWLGHARDCRRYGDPPDVDDATVKDAAAVNRMLRDARREIGLAVEHFAQITDPLEGHRTEALRLAREVRAAAGAAVRRLGE